jgi:hypothetical protein
MLGGIREIFGLDRRLDAQLAYFMMFENLMFARVSLH